MSFTRPNNFAAFVLVQSNDFTSPKEDYESGGQWEQTWGRLLELDWNWFRHWGWFTKNSNTFISFG